MEQIIIDDSLDLAEFFSIYLEADDTGNDIQNIDNTESNYEVIETETQIESNSTIPEQQEQEITALVVRKEYGLLSPNVVYTLEKGAQMSIRSFLISLALTFINLFI